MNTKTMTGWQEKLKNVIQNNRIYLAILGLIISVSRLGTWFYPFQNDHLFFLTIGREIANGKTLYLDIWDNKPPLIYYFNAVLWSLFHNNELAYIFFFTFWMLAEVWVFYKLAQTIISKTTSKNAEFLSRLAVMFYAFWRNLSQFAYSGNNTENFGLIFLLGMYLCFLKFVETKKMRWVFASGLSLSCLILLKPNLIIFTFPILAELATPLVNQLYRRNLLEFFKETFKSVKIGLLFLVPSLLHTAVWATYFNSKGALWEFWLASVEFNSKYVSSFLKDFHAEIEDYFLINMILMAALIILFCVFAWANRHRLFNSSDYRFITFAGLTSLFFNFYFAFFYPYYQAVVLPILALLLVNIGFSRMKIWSRLGLIYSLALVMFVSYGFSMLFFTRVIEGTEQTEKQELLEMTDYLNSRLEPDQTFYSYTYGTIFYYLTGRSNVSPYVSSLSLSQDYDYAYGYRLEEKVINDLEADQTDYIISYKLKVYGATPMQNYIDKCYQLEKSWLNYSLHTRTENC